MNPRDSAAIFRTALARGGVVMRNRPPATKPPRRPKGKGQSGLEKRFFALWVNCGGVPLEREHRFHAERRWRFDAAHVASKVAIEIHGSTWSNGRHVRGAGFAADRAKMNCAQAMGWVVFELCADQIGYDEIEPIMCAVFGRMMNL